MHDYHPIPDDGADEGFDAGRLSSGMETLAKCLKAAFTLLVLVIACMFIWYFTYAGVIQVNSQESAIVLTFGKLERTATCSLATPTSSTPSGSSATGSSIPGATTRISSLRQIFPPTTAAGSIPAAVFRSARAARGPFCAISSSTR